MRLGRDRSLDDIMFSLAKPGEGCDKSNCPQDRDPGTPETATVLNLERCVCECPQEGNCDPAAQPPTFWNPEECACKTCNNLAEAQNICQQNLNKDIFVRGEQCFCECPPFDCSQELKKTKKNDESCECECPVTKTDQECRFIGGIQRERSQLIFDEEQCECKCPISVDDCPNKTENTRLDPNACECYEFPVQIAGGPIFAVNEIGSQAFRALETPVAKCVEESEYLANPGKYEKLEGPFNNMQNCEFWSTDFPGYWRQTEACWSIPFVGVGWAEAFTADNTKCDCYRSGTVTEGECAWACNFKSTLKQTCDPQNYTFSYEGEIVGCEAAPTTVHPPTRYPLFYETPIIPMDPLQTGNQLFISNTGPGDCNAVPDTSCPGGFLPLKEFPCPSSTSSTSGGGNGSSSTEYGDTWWCVREDISDYSLPAELWTPENTLGDPLGNGDSFKYLSPHFAYGLTFSGDSMGVTGSAAESSPGANLHDKRWYIEAVELDESDQGDGYVVEVANPCESAAGVWDGGVESTSCVPGEAKRYRLSAFRGSYAENASRFVNVPPYPGAPFMPWYNSGTPGQNYSTFANAFSNAAILQRPGELIPGSPALYPNLRDGDSRTLNGIYCALGGYVDPVVPDSDKQFLASYQEIISGPYYVPSGSRARPAGCDLCSEDGSSSSSSSSSVIDPRPSSSSSTPSSSSSTPSSSSSTSSSSPSAPSSSSSECPEIEVPTGCRCGIAAEVSPEGCITLYCDECEDGGDNGGGSSGSSQPVGCPYPRIPQCGCDTYGVDTDENGCVILVCRCPSSTSSGDGGDGGGDGGVPSSSSGGGDGGAPSSSSSGGDGNDSGDSEQSSSTSQPEDNSSSSSDDSSSSSTGPSSSSSEDSSSSSEDSSSSSEDSSSSSEDSSSSSDCSSGLEASLVTVLDSNPELDGFYYGEDATNGFIVVSPYPVEFRYEKVIVDGLPMSANVLISEVPVASINFSPQHLGSLFAVVYEGQVRCGVITEEDIYL